MAWSMYSVMFSSMMFLTACSTSGDVPRKRRRGMRMVVPAFFSARNFQNSASVLTEVPDFPDFPVFFLEKAPVAS